MNFVYKTNSWGSCISWNTIDPLQRQLHSFSAILFECSRRKKLFSDEGWNSISMRSQLCQMSWSDLPLEGIYKLFTLLILRPQPSDIFKWWTNDDSWSKWSRPSCSADTYILQIKPVFIREGIYEKMERGIKRKRRMLEFLISVVRALQFSSRIVLCWCRPENNPTSGHYLPAIADALRCRCLFFRD